MPPSHPAGPPWLDAKLRAGGVVILDGGTGSELEARGVPMHERAWSATAALSHPEALRGVHADFLRAGAEVITTNTFAAGRHALEPAGLGDDVATINRRAVAAAREAREEVAGGPVAIAGSISEWVPDESSKWSDPAHHRAALREQAELLAAAGVDLLAVEMAMRVEQAVPAVEEALATGLPVWVGCSCGRDPATGDLRTFHAPWRPFAELVDAVASLEGVGAIHVMHSAVSDTAAGIDAVRARWDGPIGAYPESGEFAMPRWTFVEIAASDLVAAARGWYDQGARLLGGCCGLGPDHVRALAGGLRAWTTT